MNTSSPFTTSDLAELDSRLLDKAVAVVPMVEIANGKTHPGVVGLRHDIDNEIDSSVAFAQWEADRGYRSSYYVLHTAPYWPDKTLLRKSLEFIAECGHEIGIHNDAIAAAIETGRKPVEILAEAVDELRSYGFEISGTVGHGNQLCYDQRGRVRFVNDELFEECARPDLGGPGRTVAGIPIEPVPLRSLGLEYDASWLPRDAYLSDSGGSWSAPGFNGVADGFPFAGQLHVLIHACWWAAAFVVEEIAA